MKVASYNLQNLFYRHIDLVKSYRAKNVSAWKVEFEQLQSKKFKIQKDLDRLSELAVLMGFHNDTGFENVHLEHIDGELFYSPLSFDKTAKGSTFKNWAGWAKSKSIPISISALINKSKVILDADADVLIVQEIESRRALLHFNKVYLKGVYDNLYFMEGNSRLAQGMGILLKKGFVLHTLNSFANDKDEKGNTLFDNDVQLYAVSSQGKKPTYLINILLGTDIEQDRLTEQIQRLVQLLKICALDSENIILTGTLGLPSYNKHIIQLLEHSKLKQINRHPSFEVTLDKGSDASYYRLGAYTKGVNIKQQDYLLVSSKLFKKLNSCGLNRKGIWTRKRPKWDTYSSMDGELAMASEHPLLWAQFD